MTSTNLVRTSRRHPVPDGELTYEPGERHVRGVVGNITVVDSLQPVLVWEPESPVPLYAFPREDVRTDLLTETTAPARPGAHAGYDLVVDGGTRPAAAWSYGAGDLDGLIAFDWFRRREPGIDHWYEEDEEIYVHPRDPYKRVDPIRSSRHVTVSINGVAVADTRRPILLYETRLPTRYYIPPEDIDFSPLTPTDLQTRCPYKGVARYWSFPGDAAVENIAWGYPDPIPAAASIKDHVAFYNEFVDITVDGKPEERPVTIFSSRR